MIATLKTALECPIAILRYSGFRPNLSPPLCWNRT